MLYHAWHARLPMAEEGRADPHAELDQALAVTSWPSPFRKPWSVDVHADGPSWWRGDEEASQSFLRAMGVVT